MTDTTYSIVLSVRLTNQCPHQKPSRECCGNAEWMQVIHAINADHAARHDLALPAAGYIGEPTSTYEQSGGRWFEEYPEFRVILKDADTNFVQAKTAEAAEYLQRAALKVTGLDYGLDGVPR